MPNILDEHELWLHGMAIKRIGVTRMVLKIISHRFRTPQIKTGEQLLGISSAEPRI